VIESSADTASGIMAAGNSFIMTGGASFSLDGSTVNIELSPGRRYLLDDPIANRHARPGATDERSYAHPVCCQYKESLLRRHGESLLRRPKLPILWFEAMRQLGLQHGSSFDLDYHTIPFHGEDAQPRRSRAR
jgi:hypothetical protein